MKALQGILASEKFLAAPQMSAFLRYVVEQTASGNKNRIKAYTVAVDALGKPETFDPQNDPVVRVLAGRLRSTLTAHWEMHPDADVIIQMKPGSYVPNFILRDVAGTSAEGASGTDQARAETPPRLNPSASTGTLAIDPEPSAPDKQEREQVVDHRWTEEPVSTEMEQVHGAGRVAGLQERVGPATGRGQAVNESVTRNASSPWQLPRRFSSALIACAMLVVTGMGWVWLKANEQAEPALEAGNPAGIPAFSSGSIRQRPEGVTVFVSAMESAGSLESQLNTLLSGVFSESENIRVHRLLRTAQVEQFWPDDYLISLDVVPLPEETRVSVQLVNALSGRISHSETLHLSERAPEELSNEELTRIMEFARTLISDDGPLSR
ncbi:MAG: hypothetical protein HKN42_12095 [Granulosicoccus sp.]|nr:hypothetical protein [Granulosicoccus sp.]